MRPRFSDPRQFNREPRIRINRYISAPEVRVVLEEGEMLGVLPIQEALKKAEEAGLDLVEISPTAQPPVCKIIDFGKFNYQQEKKQKEARKHSKVVQNKEIKLRPKTDVHDYNFKVKHIREFLEDGNRVKVTVKFKGREMAYTENGRKQLEKIIVDIADVGKIEVPPRLTGRNYDMTLTPTKKPAGT
ncbi:MAG: translation initiation factor IF-3 [Spirochaetes bacterium]|nr:translation initiation factor IF-3 [Spirochaetota bacterium]